MVPVEIAKLTFVAGATWTFENERVIWVRCSEVMFAGTLPVVVPEWVPDAPAWLDPDWPEAPAWPVWEPDVPLVPDCVLCCEPEPVAGAPAVGRAAPPDEAAPPLWLDMPPPPDADGELAPPPLMLPPLELLPAPPLGDAAAPLPPLDPPAPAPLPLICAMPAATLKAKAATAAVLSNP